MTLIKLLTNIYFHRDPSKQAEQDEFAEDISVLFAASAAGDMAPPMILFTCQQNLPVNVARKIPTGWIVGNTENGCMTPESFFEYITNVLYPWAVGKEIELPIVIYTNMHSSYITLPLVKFCKEKRIELISLYPRTNQVQQPLDALFAHLEKESWSNAVDEFRRENNAMEIEKENFAPLLSISIDALDLEMIVKISFERCGLFPFGPKIFGFSFLDDSTGEEVKVVEDTNSGIKIAEHKKSLRYLENLMDSEVVREFKSGSVSDVKNLGLFEMWQKIRTLAEEG